MAKRFETYFWIQKKDENGENIVVANNSISSFDQIPEDIRIFQPNSASQRLKEILVQTENLKVSFGLKHTKMTETDYADFQTIYVDGYTSQKDKSGRNTCYNFIYRSVEKIDTIALETIEKSLLKCMELSKSIDYFDEMELRDALSQIDLEKCNSWKKDIIKREFGSWNRENIKEGCMVLASVAIPAILMSLIKKKGRK